MRDTLAHLGPSASAAAYSKRGLSFTRKGSLLTRVTGPRPCLQTQPSTTRAPRCCADRGAKAAEGEPCSPAGVQQLWVRNMAPKKKNKKKNRTPKRRQGKGGAVSLPGGRRVLHAWRCRCLRVRLVYFRTACTHRCMSSGRGVRETVAHAEGRCCCFLCERSACSTKTRVGRAGNDADRCCQAVGTAHVAAHPVCRSRGTGRFLLAAFPQEHRRA